MFILSEKRGGEPQTELV